MIYSARLGQRQTKFSSPHNSEHEFVVGGQLCVCTGRPACLMSQLVWGYLSSDHLLCVYMRKDPSRQQCGSCIDHAVSNIMTLALFDDDGDDEAARTASFALQLDGAEG